MRTRCRRLGRLGAFFALVALASARTALAGERPPAPVSSEAPAPSLFDETADLIRQHFWKEMTREEIELRAVRALLADIDPYASYFDAEGWSEFESDQFGGQFAGIGIVLDFDETARLPRIHYLFIDSAAGAQGARRGDLIESIDGHPMAGKSLDEAFRQLRGPAGAKVELGLLRTPPEPVIRIEVERRMYTLPSVHGYGRDASGHTTFLLDAERGIGYVRISHLAKDSVDGVKSALHDLEARDASALILDLRDSRGGLMSAAVEIADLFLASGRIAGWESRTGNKMTDADTAVAWTAPMVVLINGGTASSSEFLAAALHDNGRARFIGQRTYGKGFVQTVYRLASGRGVLVLSNARHVRPAGVATDRHDPPPADATAGIVPDPGLELAIDGEEYERWSKAIELRANPALLLESDLAGTPPDRVLDLARELLATGRAPALKGGVSP